MNRYPEAISYFERALEIAKKVFDENRFIIADIFGGMGLVLLKEESKEKQSEGLRYFESALKIRTNLFGNTGLEVATSLDKIAHFHRISSSFTESLKRDKEAFKISVGKSAPGIYIAASYYNMGDDSFGVGVESKETKTRQNYFTNALKCYRKALEIWKKTLTDRDVRIISLNAKIDALKHCMNSSPGSKINLRF